MRTVTFEQHWASEYLLNVNRIDPIGMYFTRNDQVIWLLAQGFSYRMTHHYETARDIHVIGMCFDLTDEEMTWYLLRYPEMAPLQIDLED